MLGEKRHVTQTRSEKTFLLAGGHEPVRVGLEQKEKAAVRTLCSQTSSPQCWCGLSPVMGLGGFYGVSEGSGRRQTLPWNVHQVLFEE